ncbi:hypothetical protein EP227_06840 [bacterium]|nr:MAG: hypothetical protein EP227_06840 [bacterium]
MNRKIETMDNKEFLKAVYRKRMCRFERYDEYMKNLQMLNSGKITKRDFYQNHGGERFEIYDLEKDPYEENPLTEMNNPDLLSSYKARIFELSTPSAVSEDIFPPLNRTVVKKIAKRLLAEEKIILKERYIMELQNRIRQKKALLEQIFSSNTWKIGQMYGKFFGTKSIWRRHTSHLL